MRTDLRNGASQPSMTSLVGGIFTDVRELMTQQSRLLRLEIREDLRNARIGATYLGVGLGVSAIGGLLLALALPLFLWWLAPQLPLWACFGIFGVVLLLVGGGAAYAAMKHFQEAASLSESSEALKENLTCLLRRN